MVLLLESDAIKNGLSAPHLPAGLYLNMIVGIRLCSILSTCSLRLVC